MKTTALVLATLVVASTVSAQTGQEAYLKASNTDQEDHFGYSVAASQDLAVVGAWGEDSASPGVDGDESGNGAEDAGAAYVFARSGGAWVQEAYLKSLTPDKNDRFGLAVGASGDTVVVGEPGTFAWGENPGAAQVYVRNGSSWSHQAELLANNGDEDDAFGYAVSISGDTILVGAPYEDDLPGAHQVGDEGAAYVFVRQGNNWIQEAYLKSPEDLHQGAFGYSVALSGDVAVVGTEYDDVVFVFVRNGTTWTFDGRLEEGDAEDFFGRSVAVSGGIVVVGAPEEDSSATGVDGDDDDDTAPGAGAAYVFERDLAGWHRTAYLKASNTDAGDAFGLSVAISEDAIVIDARDEDSRATGVDGDQSDNVAGRSGAAYVFVRDPSGWHQSHYLKASNTESADRFGRAVAIAGNVVAAGALGEDSAATGVNGNQNDEGAWRAGAAYAFEVDVPLGERYCSPAVANSTGSPGSLTVIGSAEVAQDSLRLVATGLPTAPNVGFFVMGQGMSVFTPPGAAGPLCVAPGLVRYLPRVETTTELDGGFEREIGTSGPISSLITPGSTWNFQAWHRDGSGPRT